MVAKSGPCEPTARAWHEAHDWFPFRERFSSKKMSFTQLLLRRQQPGPQGGAEQEQEQGDGTGDKQQGPGARHRDPSIGAWASNDTPLSHPRTTECRYRPMCEGPGTAAKCRRERLPMPDDTGSCAPACRIRYPLATKPLRRIDDRTSRCGPDRRQRTKRPYTIRDQVALRRLAGLRRLARRQPAGPGDRERRAREEPPRHPALVGQRRRDRPAPADPIARARLEPRLRARRAQRLSPVRAPRNGDRQVVRLSLDGGEPVPVTQLADRHRVVRAVP